MERLSKGERLHESVGVLRYTELPAIKLIVEVDPGISDFYRALIPKHIRSNRQMYAPHISVVRKEIPPNMDVWGKYEGHEVVFTYSNRIHMSQNYVWLNVFCTRLEEIRRELGLRVHSDYTLPPEGFNHCFHTTIGNFKELDQHGKVVKRG